MTKIFNSYFILLIFIGLIVIDQINIVSSSPTSKKEANNGKDKNTGNKSNKSKITTIKPTTEEVKHLDYVYDNGGR
uniref:CLAVATA3/ESR (CLE)-related protein n=2 Tax=Meloidogyne TaxID=189290 RepID=A0A915NYZ5_9BILA